MATEDTSEPNHPQNITQMGQLGSGQIWHQTKRGWSPHVERIVFHIQYYDLLPELMQGPSPFRVAKHWSHSDS